MKEATGEVSSSVVVITAVAALSMAYDKSKF